MPDPFEAVKAYGLPANPLKLPVVVDQESSILADALLLRFFATMQADNTEMKEP